MTTRRAFQLARPGGIDAFDLIETPVPEPEPGWVTIAVKAFGLNRSELFSRKGLSSPDFTYPRVLGLECAGVVHDPGDTGLTAGETVIALMGGMGRSFDGTYATHTTVPRRQVFAVDTELDWADLGAIPETYNTAWGMCIESMRLEADDRVLVRGGTSALGMAAASIAKHLGCAVAGTTRNPDKAAALAASGVVDHVVIDGQGFAERVGDEFGNVTAVVECVGSKATIESSIEAMGGAGKLGLGGQLAESWDDPEQPAIPGSVATSFTRSDLVQWPDDQERMQRIVDLTNAGSLQPNIHRVFGFDQLPEAHRVMEANEAVGKLVVVTD